MSYRYMRVLVLFDLPMRTTADLKEYRGFRKHLLREGFIMLQESVYCKLALSRTVAEAIVHRVEQAKPPAGLVQILLITEAQFAGMRTLVGSCPTEQWDAEERLVIL